LLVQEKAEKMCKRVAGRELTSKGEKSRHVARHEGAEVAEGSRDIRRGLGVVSVHSHMLAHSTVH
jgi:hypothetical protein